MAATQQQQQSQQSQGQRGGANSPAPSGGANKRNSRWATGPHPFQGQNNTQGQNQGQGQSRSQSPLNPASNNAASNKGGNGNINPASAPQAQQSTSNGSNNNNVNVNGNTAFQSINTSQDEMAKMHDKMLYLIAHMIGQKVTATLRSGIVYSGILSSINDIDLSVCLRLARQVESPSSSSSSSTAPQPAKAALIVSAKDIVDLYADSVDFTALSPSSGGAGGANGVSRATSPTTTTTTIRDPGGASIMAAVMNGSGGAAAGGMDSFRTDVDISKKGSGARDQRELQRWGTGAGAGAYLGGNGNGEDGGIGGSGLEDDDDSGLLEGPSGGKSTRTGGLGAGQGQTGSGKAWDQFATNEKLFGTKTDYQEEIYTTKLDKSGADYRARERRAEKLAMEIQSGVASNAHVAEERGEQVDDSGLDEEDKYSGVLRGQGAYVPPGARKGLAAGGGAATKAVPSPLASVPAKAPAEVKAQGAPAPAAAPGQPEQKTNGSLAQTLRNDASKTPELSVTSAATPTATESTPQQATDSAKPTQQQQRPEVVGDFKRFVVSEREKLLSKKLALQRSDKASRIAELKSFSQSFHLKTPVPSDLVPILSKDEQKQRDIVARKQMPTAAVVSSLAPPSSTSNGAATKPASTNVSPNLAPASLQSQGRIMSMQPASSASGTAQPPASTAAAVPAVAEKKASLYALAKIPDFNPAKAAAARAAKEAAAAAAKQTPAAVEASKPATPTAMKFNVAAPAFVMRPSAGSFVPGGAPPAAVATRAGVVPAVSANVTPKAGEAPQSVSATPKPAPPAQPLNPFFGAKVPHIPVDEKGKKITVHVKEEFSPFKLGSLAEASVMPHSWNFTGKSYRSAAPSPAPSAVGIMSPQLAAAGLPPHLQHLGSQMRAMHISSPPPSQQQGQQMGMGVAGPGPRTLMRTASSQGQGGNPDDPRASISGIGTPVPSSNTSQAGIGGPPPFTPVQAQMMVPGPHGPIPQMMPQGFIFHPQQGGGGFPGQQQPGGPGGFRYMPNGQPQQPQQQQGGPPPTQQQLQQMQAQGIIHPGQQQHMQQQMLIGPNGQPVHFQGHPGGAQHGGHFIQMPFSPQLQAGGHAPMFSPQMAGQMPPGQPFMSPMFMPQQQGGGQRGGGQQTPQMAPGQQHIFYQQMGAAPGMGGGGQYMQMQGGPPQQQQQQQQGQGQQQGQQQQPQQGLYEQNNQ